LYAFLFYNSCLLLISVFFPNFPHLNVLPLTKRLPFALSILSGLLLWAAWPVSPLTFIIFFAFVPLLYVSDIVQKSRVFFLYTYITCFVWNLLTTWWIFNSSAVGFAMALIPNAFLMSLPWWGYFISKKRFGKNTAYAILICFWMLFEYTHLNWQLNWPWLTLGNVFAVQISWVQWYEYTGAAGGTLWVLLVNILIYALIQHKRAHGKISPRQIVPVILSLLIPFVISFLVSPSFKNSNTTALPVAENNVVIVQPNIDAYQKFGNIPAQQQIQTLLRLTESAIDNNTRLVIWPETALSENAEISHIQEVPAYKPIYTFLQQHSNITLQTGIETYKLLGTEKTSITARKFDGYYYDAYNAAITIKAGEPSLLYVKSKLVPGVETLPTYVNFLAPVFEHFGGTTGGYAKDTAAVAFRTTGNPYVTAPIICYESIYGEYVTEYVQKGANLLTIMTNDGWWGNTPGHKQHLAYASLRAIETRRYIARSANTGISAVINDEGKILDTKGWDEETVLKASIPPLYRQTFYVKHGDYLFRIASGIAVLSIVWNLLVWFRTYRSKKRNHAKNISV